MFTSSPWFRAAALGLLSLIGVVSGAFAAEKRTKSFDAFAIATAHPKATEAGIEILKRGGNAFDAAAAVTAALAVVEPYSSGLGGGGFYLLHQAENQRNLMLDARERAPLAAHRDMYLDAEGEVVPGLSINGALAAGIPGIPAALEALVRDYGTLDLGTVLTPAIRLAREGFVVDERYRKYVRFRRDALAQSPAAASVFLFGRRVPPPGHLIHQSALASTLQRIAREGADGFYRGPLALQLVNGVRQAGGIWSLRDLEEYEIKFREPIVTEYKGVKMTSASPPSSGGVALATMLGVLSRFDLDSMSPGDRLHTIVEAMRAAYRDRAEFLGDPDLVDMPLDRLLSAEHAAELAAAIDPGGKAPSPDDQTTPPKGTDTTHFSIMDAEGNRVAATLSINYPFGSAFMVPGTGVLLNDEMDDFSAKPGVANAYGLVGSEANAIEPGKRMLSSMSPTFLESDERIAVLGTPGGSRIITMVLLAALEFVRGNGAAEMVALPRFHHQYLPDRVEYEKGRFVDELIRILEDRGYAHKAVDPLFYGNMQVVVSAEDGQRLEAASDPRGVGLAAVCVKQNCTYAPASFLKTQ
ncbi:MAG: gamma-glutamyltransferase [Gammaproteobacteria bacterium]